MLRTAPRALWAFTMLTTLQACAGSSIIGMPDGGLAGHLCDRWVFHRPFHIGDTLGCRHRTLAVRKSKSRPDTGVVTCGLQLLNQRDEVTMSAEVLMMFPAGGA